MRVYIVTGAAGLVGTNLIRKLSLEDVKIVAILNKKNMNESYRNVETVFCDVRNKECLDDVFAKYSDYETICIHCAGIITIKTKNDSNVFDVNVKGTANIVDLCMKYNYKLIYVSSVHAIRELPKGNVITETTDFDSSKLNGVYAKSKAEATKIVLDNCNNGLNACVVHPSGIIGPYDYNGGNFTTLIEQYVNGKLPAIVKGGYDFVDVRDVVDGIIGAINYGRSGECYLLTNKYYSVKELIDILSDITGKKKINFIMPTWFIKLVAPLFELYSNRRGERPLFTPYSIFVLHTNSLFSHAKATRELGYSPRDLRDTLEVTYKWIKNK